LKVVYNLAVPYELLRRQDEKAGISVMVYLEFILLILAVIVSCFVKTTSGIITPGKVALAGIVVILGSYVHFVLVMMTGGWLICRKKKS